MLIIARERRPIIMVCVLLFIFTSVLSTDECAESKDGCVEMYEKDVNETDIT